MTKLVPVKNRNLALNPPLVAVAVTALALVSGNASAADAAFVLDTTSVMSAIGTTVAAVTAVGMGAMSIFLVVKALKYIKTAF